MLGCCYVSISSVSLVHLFLFFNSVEQDWYNWLIEIDKEIEEGEG